MIFDFSSACDIAPDKLPFSFLGLCLQEPMALVTNWLLAATAFIIFFKIQQPVSAFQKHWKYFYLTFGFSTFFGGLGHLFFYYFGIPGKFPCWIFGVLAAYHAGKAMLSINFIAPQKVVYFERLLILKGITFGLLALWFQSFLFVMADAVVTYLFFCLGFGLYYWRKGMQSFRYTVYAVLILFPSIFIFLLQINPHLWFNKDDLSHVLMATTIVFFYLGIINFDERTIHRHKLK